MRLVAGPLIIVSSPVFNCALIFDVSLNSWHSLPSPIKFPSTVTRNSLAACYLSGPDKFSDYLRFRAEFAHSVDLTSDVEDPKRIEARSDLEAAYFMRRLIPLVSFAI